ncbi:MAG: nitroreductase family protein [Marmoricola sp.]
MSTPTRALALRVIELACRAPSVHNSQPWRWRVVDEATIELYADRRRQLTVSDPSGRNLSLSCGAAIHHGFAAAQALGLTAAIELMPLRDDETLLARISLTSGTRTDEALETLKALEERSTDRRRFTSWPVPESRLAHLAKAASGWGAHAVPITDVTARFRVEQLLRRAMAVQASDPRFAEEQRRWTVHSRRDGMSLANAAPPVHGRPPTRPNRFVSASDAEAIEAADAARMVENSDGLIAICSATDDQVSWLEAGEALSALWLQATHDGLSIVPLSQVVEVDETRQALHHDVFDDLARPQILIRVGWLESSRARLDRTPRRPTDEVTEG